MSSRYNSSIGKSQAHLRDAKLPPLTKGLGLYRRKHLGDKQLVYLIFGAKYPCAQLQGFISMVQGIESRTTGQTTG